MERMALLTLDQHKLVVREESEKIRSQMHHDHDKITSVIAGDNEKQVEKITVLQTQEAKEARYRDGKLENRMEKMQATDDSLLEVMRTLQKTTAETNERLEIIKGNIAKITWIVGGISSAVGAGAVMISGTM